MARSPSINRDTWAKLQRGDKVLIAQVVTEASSRRSIRALEDWACEAAQRNEPIYTLPELDAMRGEVWTFIHRTTAKGAPSERGESALITHKSGTQLIIHRWDLRLPEPATPPRAAKPKPATSTPATASDETTCGGAPIPAEPQLEAVATLAEKLIPDTCGAGKHSDLIDRTRFAGVNTTPASVPSCDQPEAPPWASHVKLGALYLDLDPATGNVGASLVMRDGARSRRVASITTTDPEELAQALGTMLQRMMRCAREEVSSHLSKS